MTVGSDLFESKEVAQGKKLRMQLFSLQIYLQTCPEPDRCDVYELSLQPIALPDRSDVYEQRLQPIALPDRSDKCVLRHGITVFLKQLAFFDNTTQISWKYNHFALYSSLQ